MKHKCKKVAIYCKSICESELVVNIKNRLPNDPNQPYPGARVSSNIRS